MQALVALPSLAGAAGAAGTAGGVLSSIGTIGSLLSGGLSVLSAVNQMKAGNYQAQVANMQAQQAEISARTEILRGRQQSLEIKKQLDRDLASSATTFAARGFLAGEGTAQAALDVSRQNATEDINIAMFGANMGSESDKLRAAQIRATGAAQKTASRVGAASTLLEGFK